MILLDSLSNFTKKLFPAQIEFFPKSVLWLKSANCAQTSNFNENLGFLRAFLFYRKGKKYSKPTIIPYSIFNFFNNNKTEIYYPKNSNKR